MELEFDCTPVGSTPLLVPPAPTERPRSRDAQVLHLGRGTDGSNPVPSSGESRANLNCASRVTGLPFFGSGGHARKGCRHGCRRCGVSWSACQRPVGLGSSPRAATPAASCSSATEKLQLLARRDEA